MASLITSNNFLVNALMFPGLFHSSSYSVDTYKRGRDEAIEAAKPTAPVEKGKVVVKPSPALRLLFIPFQFKYLSAADYLNQEGRYIPAVLAIADNSIYEAAGSIFVIHFHGNACDNGQVSVCAVREGYSLNAHYLLVEYPRYGFAKGFPTDTLLQAISQSVYDFVINELHVPPSNVVLIGRSVGCGPVCHLASVLQQRNVPPRAIILQSPYTSIRDTAEDLIGCVAWFMLDRWPSWKYLAYTADRRGRLKRNAAAPAVTAPEQSKPNFDDSVAVSPKSESKSSDSKVAAGQQQQQQQPPSLFDCLCFTPPAVIQCPVLFIHADRDQIIDHHHSVTMHALRTRDDLPSELYTQVSTPIFTKDHNHYDYDGDVIIPSRDFLAKYVDYTKPGMQLPADVIAAVCLVPPEYQGALYREQARERPVAAVAADVAAAVAAATVPPAAGTPLKAPTSIQVYSPPSKWTACLALRCLACCPLCFCTECTVAIVTKGLKECFYATTGQAPAFQYATKAERRKSGGIPQPVDEMPGGGATWKTVDEQHVKPHLPALAAAAVAKLLRKGEAARVEEVVVISPLQEQVDRNLATPRAHHDVIPSAHPRRLSADNINVPSKLNFVPG